ncbi:MAG: hypothetical protein AAF242_14780 [Bacteroidota bacterium]
MIRAKRLDDGVLQKDLTKQLRVTATTIENWELRGAFPPTKIWPKIIEFLGYNPLLTLEPSRTIGKKLWIVRMSLGLTHRSLAPKIGLDPTTISRVEGRMYKGTLNGKTLVAVELFIEEYGASLFKDEP